MHICSVTHLVCCISIFQTQIKDPLLKLTATYVLGLYTCDILYIYRVLYINPFVSLIPALSVIRVPPVSHLKRDKSQLVERVNSLQSSIDQSMATLKVSSRTFAVAKSPNYWLVHVLVGWLTLFTHEFLQQPTSINESFKISFIGKSVNNIISLLFTVSF